VTIAAYPLQWPEGWKRTQADHRKAATFTKYKKPLSVYDGVQRVMLELDRLGLGRDDVVISTNVETRMDGFPRSDRSEPRDPGVAVYWQEKRGGRRVMAIDHYTRVADNLAAVAATLDAMRAIERHGGAAILERAFTGFTALPAPGAAREWWEVLGVPRTATAAEIQRAYRELAARHHPDRGGSAALMAEINAARDAAERF
jgi:hypothetical protein